MINPKLAGKTLLVQGAGRGNLGIVQAAKANSVKTIVTGLGGNYPCSILADKECYADIMDVEAVLRVAEDNCVDGAVICCSDTGLQAVGRCNDKLKLCGITEESSVLSSNKYEMKRLLIANGVRTAPFFKIEDADNLYKAVESIGYPVIIKATDLQGSRGIYIVRTEEDLKPSFEQVMDQTHESYCIVEKFLEGKEYGAQSFVYNNDVLFVLPHGDETIMCKTAVPIGHYMPYEISDELAIDTEVQVKKAIAALGLNNCPVNVDLIEVEGKAYIIELTGRVGANCLPELVGNYYGFNYYEMILNTVLGESPLPIFNSRKAVSSTLARMVKAEKTGTVESVEVPLLPETDILMFISPGDKVRAFTNCNDAIGQIVVFGDTLDECEKKMAKAERSIKVEIA